ncbi:ABC transporter substrate-binding protein [Thermodesulfovibrionales bacterium]|nr:ABC transporter substrate-binding protein [Thermodesulfovibrionales bacterium]
MKMNKKIAGLVICLLLLGGVLAVYITQQPERVVEEPQALEIGIRCLGHADGLVDPAIGWSSWFSRRAGIYETLTKLDHNMELQPWLATSWEPLDETTWEFQLRRGVIFHDGTPLDSLAVKQSLVRLIDEDSPVHNPRAQPLLNIKEIEVVDKYTLRITTLEPFAPLIYHLSDPLMAIVSQDIEQGEIPAGTGPFKFVEQQPGEYVVVERFADYWGGAAKLEKVTFRLIPDAMTRAMALEAGDIDVAVAITAVDALRLKETAGVKVATGEIHRTDFIKINCQQEPLNDARVRRAISYAIDREGIIEAVLEGIAGTPAATIFPPTLPWSNRDLQAVYDLDKAKTLLAEAGLTDTDGDGFVEHNGESFKVRFLAPTHRPEFGPIAEIIKDMLPKIGIQVEIVTLELGAAKEMVKAGDFDLFMTSWGTAPSGDPAYILEMLVSTTGDANYGKFSCSVLDKLLSEGKTTLEPQTRAAIYNEIQERIREESPLIFLYHRVDMLGMSEAVQGLEVHPAEMYLLHKDVYLN